MATGSSSPYLDSVIAYRILKMLVMPFENTDAYKLGIIDKDGNELKKQRQLKTKEEKESYTILHRLVFRVKKILNKIPMASKQFSSLAVALALIRENYEKNKEPIELERMFLEGLQQEQDTSLVESYLMQNKKTFRHFLEDVAMGAPANSAAAAPGVAGLERDAPNVPVPAKNKLNIFRRKKNVISAKT